MTDTNPFQAPEQAARPSPSRGGAWADGATLVTPPRCTLTDRCVKCGRSETVSPVRVRVRWVPLWVRLTILIGALPFLILFLVLGKEADIQVGLCSQHRMVRQFGILGGVGALLGGLALACGGLSADTPAPMLGGMLLVLIALVPLILFASPLRAVRVTATEARWAGAHADFLAHLR